MFLSPCLLAAALLQDAPATAEPEIPKAFANLDTMRRMLVRKVGEKSADIGPKVADSKPNDNEAGSDTDGDGFPDDGTASRNKVAVDFLRATRNAQGEAVIGSHGEYVPGLAAVISLTVPVRTDTARAKADAAPETAKAHNEDDADWEEIATGDERGSWKAYEDMFQRGDVEAVVQSYSPVALAALRKTVVDTMWRFGHKLELGHGERLAVVVTVQPAADAFQGWWRAQNTPSPSYDRALQGMLKTRANGTNPSLLVQPPPSQRIVFQVSGDDLRAYKAGDLEQDELAKKTRVQSFTLPAEEPQRVLNYGSSSAR